MTNWMFRSSGTAAARIAAESCSSIARIRSSSIAVPTVSCRSWSASLSELGELVAALVDSHLLDEGFGRLVRFFGEPW
jgi:hypothetical protein